MKSHILLREIISYLSYLESKVTLSNSINLTDVNIHAENFYCNLLNLVFNFKLKNVNQTQRNAAAIDLEDSNNKIAVQITSDHSLKKIKNTFESFINNKLHMNYNQLIVFTLKKKLKYKSKHLKKEGFEFQFGKHVWDNVTIISKIQTFSHEKLSNIVKFLEEELGSKTLPKCAKEINTFMQLINILSNDNYTLTDNFYKEEPDPHKKINDRFKTYSSFINSQYTLLYAQYGASLKKIYEEEGVERISLSKLRIHLMDFSNKLIDKYKEDAKRALDEMTEYYQNLLSQHQVDHDLGAIRFFLIDQLIRCNVFPMMD